MRYRWLRYSRRGIACVVMVLAAAGFVLAGTVLARSGDAVLSVQAVPAVIRLAGPGLAPALGLLALLFLVTALAGRIYCACLCPLGIFQDFCRRLGRLIPIVRKRQDRGGPLRGARRRVIAATILVTVLFTVSADSLLLLGLLDPYSAWGRLATSTFRPLSDAFRQAAAGLFERVGIYAFSGAGATFLPAPAWVGAVLFMSVLVVSAVLWGRLFCTMLCPVGTCLGMVSRHALFRIRVDRNACTRCGKCVGICRSDCISLDRDAGLRIDHSQCVVCGDCLATCPADALRWGRESDATEAASLPAASREDNRGRRRFLAVGTAVVAAGVPVRLLLAGRDADGSTPAMSPPGSVGVDRFAAMCTSCHRCVAACPTGVIQPGLAPYGWRGLLQPRLSFRHGYCEYDCTRCGDVCPNHAILPLAIDEKHRTQTGVAALREDRCVVYLRGEDCGACAEVCPTHAVHTEARDGVLYPKMAVASCVGCGACEHVCPQDPEAISVTPHLIHRQASPPYRPTPDSTSSTITPSDDSGEGGFPF